MKIASMIGKIALGLVTGIFLLGFLSSVGEMKDERSYYREGIVEIHDFTLEEIGSSYRGEEAQEGYRYYRMKIEAENVSHFSEREDCVWRYYEGSAYGDVEEPDEGYSSAFRYDNMPLIPAGRTAVLEDILLIRDGVAEVEVSYEIGYDGKEQQISVRVP